MEQNRLGKRINEVRRDRCLTAEKLSELCNINATYLRQIEGGSKELGENEISKIQEIEKLWEDASPRKQELALTMIKAVLEHTEQ